MKTILTQILADKHIWLKNRKLSQPLNCFIDKITPSERSFHQALQTKNTAFILECKKASPSKGLIRTDFDLEYISRVYGNHANAISVLTDEKYFQGSFDFLNSVRKQVPLPVLCKDFILDPYQVYLARYYNADAILLMLSILEDQQYRTLAKIAQDMNLDVLTEISNEEEQQRALALGARIIGINNRNLRDLSIDLDRTKRLASSISEDTVIVSESGLSSHSQIRKLSPHVNAFLVGSSLMKEQDLERAVRRMLYGENKVCGLTCTKDAKKAYQANAVFGGLIFIERSPRFVTEKQAKTIMTGAPLHYVGVFCNQPVETIINIATRLTLSAVQLHGEEDRNYISILRTQLPEGCAIWKAYGISEASKEIPELKDKNIERYLLDRKIKGQSGGTGQVFNWSLLNTPGFDTSLRSHIMLAGGLSPKNTETAAKLGCLGLDFNSGVEKSPGIKDTRKLHIVFQAIRKYGRTGSVKESECLN